MFVLKCKMCGGDLKISPNQSSGKCEYCGSVMALPKVNEERVALLYDRANTLRAQKEFDKAQMTYEGITAERPDDAEAYWGAVICRFGIEYVPDPATGEHKPTMHRMQFDSILEDANYKNALAHADPVAKTLYAKEAERIHDIQTRFLSISSREEPFDAFICYKETEETGGRTQDSVCAEEIYNELTARGLRVFFARITLEDKLGEAYEPYIFAALNSARVMLVVGTSAEKMNGAWVKNEWQRYLYLMRRDKDKHLLPVYLNMNPYDMPPEFQPLQSQDMRKIGALQDLSRGVLKLAKAPGAHPKESLKNGMPGGESALITRAYICIEDGEFEDAKGFLETFLNQNPTHARAYLGKALCALGLRGEEALKTCEKNVEDDINYKRALRYADDALKDKLQTYADYRRAYAVFRKGEAAQKAAKNSEQFMEAAKIFAEASPTVPEAAARAAQCRKMADDVLYAAADKMALEAKTAGDCRLAAEAFHKISRIRDAEARAQKCREQADDILYADADALAQKARTAEAFRLAADAFDKISGIRDADARAEECRRGAEDVLYFAADQRAKNARTAPEHEAAAKAFEEISGIRDAAQRALDCRARVSEALYDSADQLARTARTALEHFSAAEAFEDMRAYKDAEKRAQECRERANNALFAAADEMALSARTAREHIAAAEAFEKLSNMPNAPHRARECRERAENASQAEEERKHGIRKPMLDRLQKLCALRGVHTDATQLVYAGDAEGELARYIQALRKFACAGLLCAGTASTVAVQAGGCLLAAGENGDGRLNVRGWTNIVSVASGLCHTVGLKADGTVVCTGDNYHGQCDTAGWTGIVQIAAGDAHTVGLKANGSVVATGFVGDGQCDTGKWEGVVEIAAGCRHTVGLKADGSVVCAGDNARGQCDTDKWKDITSVAAGYFHTVGLRANGSVVCAGDKRSGQQRTRKWKNVVAVAAGDEHTVALRADGGVYACGENENGQLRARKWKRAAALAAGGAHTVAIFLNGGVKAVGNGENGQLKTHKWKRVLPEV